MSKIVMCILFLAVSLIMFLLGVMVPCRFFTERGENAEDSPLNSFFPDSALQRIEKGVVGEVTEISFISRFMRGDHSYLVFSGRYDSELYGEVFMDYVLRKERESNNDWSAADVFRQKQHELPVITDSGVTNIQTFNLNRLVEITVPYSEVLYKVEDLRGGDWVAPLIKTENGYRPYREEIKGVGPNK